MNGEAVTGGCATWNTGSMIMQHDNVMVKDDRSRVSVWLRIILWYHRTVWLGILIQ